ncbi:MAG: response regulator [Xenococcaceae cyanobacterium]
MSRNQKQVNQTDNLFEEEVSDLLDDLMDTSEDSTNSTTDDLLSLLGEDFSEELADLSLAEEEPSEATTSDFLPSDCEISDLFDEDFSFEEDSSELQNLDVLDFSEIAEGELSAAASSGESVTGDLAALFNLKTGGGELKLDAFEEEEEISGLEALERISSSAPEASEFDELEQLLDFEPTEKISSSEKVTDLEFFTKEDRVLPYLYEQFEELDALLEEPAGMVAVEDNGAVFFDELEALIDSPATAIPEASEFDELEQLLDFELTEDISTSEKVADLEVFTKEVTALPYLYEQFEELDALLEESAGVVAVEDNGAVSFDELEALIDSPATAIKKTRTSIEQQTSALEKAATSIAPSSQKKENIDEGFEELEKLLVQANETMGGPPTVKFASKQSRKPQTRTPKVKVFEQTMRIPVKQLDDLSNLIGELVVKRNRLEQDQERLQQFLDNLLNQVQNLNDVGGRMQDLHERTLLEGALLASTNQDQSSGNHLPHSDSNDQGLNALEMDRFTGFHLLSGEMIELIVRVRESASDIQFLVDETEQVAQTLRQVTNQLQEGITKSRMVPFAHTAERLPRAIREISLKLNKKVKLHVEGREVLIDKMILEHLYNPMTHLVNNAITHGIESPEVRQRQGKPPEGRITIRAFLQGNQTVISVSDDGAGINPDKVKAKAIEKRLITKAEAQSLSNKNVYDFLFHPGFSTKDQADDFAGRGVGMDVVRTGLSEIRGTIGIDSTLGEGTTFTIRLPLTLSIGKALCCLSNRARIAFPMDGVENTKDYLPSNIKINDEGHKCIPWGDTLLPFQPLSNLLSYNRKISRGTVYGGKEEDDTISIIVLRGAGNFLAIQVDQVLGEEEIVIKQIEGPVPKPPGIAGATVLGDGSIMPIGDVLELIEIAHGRMPTNISSNLWQQAYVPVEQEAAVKTEPMVLIVDDSITVRGLLSLSFSKAGYRVEQARDGQEAWEKIRSGLPCDIIFCDIEMPRMNGLELLSLIHKDEQLASIPVALLTSRGAERHQKVAADLGASGYFIKPYTEKDLLDGAERMIKGEVLLAESTRVSVPLKEEETVQPPEEVEPEEVVKSAPRVLIIDDSVTVRAMVATTFNKAGYQVEQARDGQEAWEKLHSGEPCDIVLCDIEMPRMNGFELLSLIQKDEKLSSVPIAMVTSRGAERHRKMAADLGAKGYFTKPYIEEELLDAARRLIAGEVLLENSSKVEG